MTFNEKNDLLFNMFQEYWKLIRKYWDNVSNNDDKIWEEIIDDMGNFIEKYRDTEISEFVNRQAQSLVKELEKRGKNKNETNK